MSSYELRDNKLKDFKPEPKKLRFASMLCVIKEMKAQKVQSFLVIITSDIVTNAL